MVSLVGVAVWRVGTVKGTAKPAKTPNLCPAAACSNLLYLGRRKNAQEIHGVRVKGSWKGPSVSTSAAYGL